MHDLIFSDASKFSGGTDSLDLGPTWIACFAPFQDLASAFAGNIARLHALVALPSVVILNEEHRTRLMSQTPRQLDHDFVAFIHSGVQEVQMLASEIELVHAGLHAILASQVIGAWTAFESLATDCWERTINVCPDVLSHAFGIEKADRTKDRTEKVPLTPAAILRAKLDPHVRLGTELYEHWMKSTSRNGIVKAYGIVFGDRPEICECVANGELVILEAMRNLLAHRGGVVDQQFIDKVAGHAMFSHYGIGDDILLTGTLTSHLTQSVVESGRMLLLYLCNMLSEPRPPLGP